MRDPWIHRVSFLGAILVALSVVGCQDSSSIVEPEGIQLSAGGWDDKVTAGGEAMAGGTVFHLSAAASSNSDGAWGQMEYWRDENNGLDALYVHADVTCLWVSSDLTTAALFGPVKSVQEDPGGQVPATDPYMRVTFVEGGTGSGDLVGVNLTSGPPSGDNCAVRSTPGEYTDGNVNIRNK